METNDLLNTGISLAELLLAVLTVGIGGYTAGRQMAIARLRTERRARLLELLSILEPVPPIPQLRFESAPMRPKQPQNNRPPTDKRSPGGKRPGGLEEIVAASRGFADVQDVADDLLGAQAELLLDSTNQETWIKYVEALEETRQIVRVLPWADRASWSRYAEYLPASSESLWTQPDGKAHDLVEVASRTTKFGKAFSAASGSLPPLYKELRTLRRYALGTEMDDEVARSAALEAAKLIEQRRRDLRSSGTDRLAQERRLELASHLERALRSSPWRRLHDRAYRMRMASTRPVPWPWRV